jgi:diguanylate cyclase (GGDEF)-like protein
MDQVLRPGMRLLRRFSVAGKFMAIALLLIVPLSILAAGSISTAARQVRAVGRERTGLALVRPLGHLLAGLGQARIGAVTGTDLPDLAESIAEVDAVQDRLGDPFELRTQWRSLRAEVLDLPRPAGTESGVRRSADPGQTPSAEAQRAYTRTVALLGRVADASRLTLDPQLDSFYLARALTDRVPAVVDAAATIAEQSPSERPAAHEVSMLSARLSEPVRRLTTDLGTAVARSAWDQLDGRLRPSVQSLRTTLSQFGTALASGRAGLTASPLLGTRVGTCAAATAEAVATALDAQLAEREHDLFVDGSGPLLAALVSLLACAYLFAALARATSSDAREVLADISAVTNGALHQTRPLPGNDEFARMSHAVVIARDRLTSLLGTLRYQATHDDLTALGNRALFTEKLAEALAEPGPRLGVVVIDLDGFKDVNDSFGHLMGDRLLRTVGARFHRAVRRRDLVARVGADQFGVLLMDADDEQRAGETLAALRTAVEQPVNVDGRLLRVRASIGIAFSPRGEGTATELLRNADVAMHTVKGSGSGLSARFEPAMHEATRERTELSFELVQAVEQEQLSVVYQPIVDLTTDVVRGVEALVRWDHPVRGRISPTVFVPLAESTGQIVPIGRWVLRQAVDQLARWRAQFPDGPALTMDVNLSADQLGDPDLVGDVLSLISRTGIDPGWLVLEITESALMRDLDTALVRLAQLDAMGIRLALDDFGTGYSSLAYLRRLPVEVLKIDKSFVTADDGAGGGARHPDAAAVLLRGITALGTGLGMELIAEGIETGEQVARLRAAGCHLGQGYHWSPPMPADQLEQVLRRGGRIDAVPRQRGSRAPTAR